MTIKSKRLFQVLVVWVLVMSSLGGSRPALASSNVSNLLDAHVYVLTLGDVVQLSPASTTAVSPTNLNVGESGVVTVSLENVPADGYASAEFACTYSATLVEVSNIAATPLFGTDPVVALNYPQDGGFIVAIAGSNENKATSSGAVFTFSVEALQPGQMTLECVARVSKGDDVLTTLPSTGAKLTVLAIPSTPTFTPTAMPSATLVESATPINSPTATAVTPVESATATSATPVESPTATSSTPAESPTASATLIESPTATLTSTPVSTATSTPVPTTGNVTGKVTASKPVTVSLYDASNTLIAAITANGDGTFSLTAPAGSYTIRATANGFLGAQGPVTMIAGVSASMPTIALLAGDIDGNNVIDPFDALTIGMGYNTIVPAAADLNNDGIINVLDLELLAQNYRKTGPLSWAVSYP